MASRGEHDPVVRAAVRLWNRDQEVVGGGFLVGPDVIATCAHVVADALGIDPYGPPPDRTVEVDFPLLRDDLEVERLDAVVQHWVPIADDGGGDIALLRLRSAPPPAARMPPLRRIERLWDHRFRVLGFPDGAWDGVWATGRIRGQQGTGWFQLQGDPGGQPVLGGFSGAPVWDLDSGAVVGMTVAADRGGTTTAYLVPIDGVIGVDPETLPCPYRGLAPFGEEDAALFFGRDDDVARLLDVVSRQPVVAVAGPSGVGKSSLVRAGLLPRLRAQGAQIAEVRPAPGIRPELPEPAAGQVLLLDQFEEFAAANPAGARDLLTRAVAATSPTIDPAPGTTDGTGADTAADTAAEPERHVPRLVLTVRWSALEEMLTPDLAAALGPGTVLLASLDRGGLRQAVVGPAERAPGLDFEEGLVERILDDAGTDPGRLPLVASLLADLWQHRDGGRLTLHGYRSAGGVAGAVAQHAERVVAQVDGGTGAVRALFTLLAGTDREGRFVRRPVRVAELPVELRRLVPRLAAERLLVVDDGGSAGTVQMAHQALIDHWPRLRGWLAEDRDFLSWRARLEEARERWDDAARDDGALLRGAGLAVAGEWVAARGAQLSADQREYVRRSTLRHRREVRRWRIVTAVLAVLVVVAGVLAVVATNRGNEATARGDELAAQLRRANADLLGREALSRSRTDRAVAAQLALAAWRSDPQNPQARSALAVAAIALQAAEVEFTDALDRPLDGVVVRGDTALVIGADGFTAVTGTSGDRIARRPLPDLAIDEPVAVSPDGRWLVDADRTEGLRVRDLLAGAEPRTVLEPGGGIPQPNMGIGFSPDGSRIGWRFLDPAGDRFRVLDLATGQVTDHDFGPLADAAFSMTADPTRVVFWPRRDDDQPGVVRSLVDGAELARLPAGAQVVLGGAAAVSCAPGDPATFTVTPLGGTVAARTFPGTTGACDGARIAGGGEVLLERVAGIADLHVQVLTDLRSGEQSQLVAPPITDPPDDTDPIPLSGASAVRGPDGRPRLLVASGRALLRLRPEPVPSPSGPGPARYIDSSGRYFVASLGTSLVVEDRATGQRLAEMPWAEDGRKLAAADDLWVLERSGGGWRASRFELPSLRRTASFPVPDDRREPSVEVPAEEGPLFTVADGSLVALDPVTGQELGRTPRIEGILGDTNSGDPLLWSRRGHPGQVAVLTEGGELQIWDAVAGELVDSTATSPRGFALSGLSEVVFDAAGTRLALIAGQQEIRVWDIGSGRPLRSVPVAPNTFHLLGFAPDGLLVAATYEEFSPRLVFYDPTTGQEAGSVEPGAQHLLEARLADDGTRVLSAGAGSLPLVIPVTAQAWFERVCAVTDRPFTEGELALLPAGISTDPPCR